MILARRVALNGVYLDQVDSRICISSVETADGRENIAAVDTAAGFGQRITSKRRTTLDIIVKFRMKERGRTTLGMTERAELLEDINAWAAPGGILTANFKPGRRAHVILAQAPGEGSLWDFTKEFQMTFRAYAIPYWEDATASSKTIGGEATTASDTFTVGGSADTQVDVSIENTSESVINTGSVSVGVRVMGFTGLGLAAGETLVIDHDDNGLVRIRIRNTENVYRSAMASRVAASVDDYVVGPGVRECSFTMAQACSMTVNWRARYL